MGKISSTPSKIVGCCEGHRREETLLTSVVELGAIPCFASFRQTIRSMPLWSTDIQWSFVICRCRIIHIMRIPGSFCFLLFFAFIHFSISLLSNNYSLSLLWGLNLPALCFLHVFFLFIFSFNSGHRNLAKLCYTLQDFKQLLLTVDAGNYIQQLHIHPALESTQQQQQQS